MSESLSGGRRRVEDASAVGWTLPPLAGDLPDINVWLALCVQEHPHHAVARAYWEDGLLEKPTSAGSGANNLWFCRTTMLGLVRLLCQPRVVGPGALQLPQAYALYRSLVAVPGVALLADPAGAETRLQGLLDTGPLPPRLWTDAWLAATALASGLRLVTFDRDFARFALPQCLVLN